MQFSINIGWFKEQFPSKEYGIDFYKLPNRIKNAGFSAMEFYPSVNIFSTDTKLINRLVKNADLSFYSGHLPMIGNILSFDKKIYSERLSCIKQWLEYFSKLNIEVAVIHPDEISFPLKEHSKRMDLLIKFAHSIAKHAKKFNIKIAVETTWRKGSLFAHIENIKYFKKNIRADNLGFCFDTGHVWGSESKEAKKNVDENFWNTWEVMKDKIVNFHLHNTDVCSDKHNPFEQGGINFKKFLKEVDKMNYSFPLTIEMNPIKLLKKEEVLNNGNLDKALQSVQKMIKKHI